MKYTKIFVLGSILGDNLKLMLDKNPKSNGLLACLDGESLGGNAGSYRGLALA